MRKRAQSAEASSTSPPPSGRAWFGLYRGDDVGADGSPAPTWAGPESSVLVLGPPRSGKTTSLVIPAVLDAPAAVVSTSTKPDVVAATSGRRHLLGNPFVFDPTGTLALPPGTSAMRWSPVVGCADFERAVVVAHALAGAARPGSALTESAHWVERAEALLAPLLFAAARYGADMATVCRWVLSRDLREPLAVLEASGHPMAQAVMAGVAETEDRERSGIFSSAAGLLSAYRSEAALATTAQPNFDPGAFARSADTLYICAPSHAQEQLAPIVVALLEQIRAAVYTRPPDAAPVVFALDEVANIAPLPSLPALAAEGGGQGLVTLACLQDLSQARARWGAEAEGFFSLFSTKIVFPGIGDQRTLALISALAGEQPTIVCSRTSTPFLAALLTKNPPAPTTTRSITWRPRLPLDEVARGRQGHVLALAGSSMSWLRVLPWRQHPRWAPLGTERCRVGNEVLRPLEFYDPKNIPAPDLAATSTAAAYGGPGIVRSASSAAGSWVWIDSGSAEATQRFAVPSALDPPAPKSLAPAPAVRATSVVAPVEGDGSAQGYDPVFDDTPAAPRAGDLNDVVLPRGVDSLDDLRIVIVNVLGPVEVQGWLVAPDRAMVTELACYLALHRGRSFSGEELRAALRPDAEHEVSAKTMRTYLSMLRKCLGPDYLSSGGGYGVPWFVDTDFAIFERSLSIAFSATDPQILEYIRGRPFEGVPAGTYGWVFSELWISQIETRIVAAVQRLATLCLDTGRIDQADYCIRQGLLGVPQDLSLWELRLETATRAGAGALDRARKEATAALGPDALDLAD